MFGLAVTSLVLLLVADADSVGVRCPKGFICETAAGGCADEHDINAQRSSDEYNGTQGLAGSEA